MKTVYIEQGTSLDEQTVVCLGFFDGVHLGHKRLVEQAITIRHEKRLKVCVHTFDRMPAQVLQPALALRELTPLSQKRPLLAALGVDILAVSPFTAQVMRMRAQAFFNEILLDALCARHIVCGFHHRFGYRGEADVNALAAMCERAGIGLSVIPPVTLPGGELISATAIREALRLGDLERAERMLGRPYRAEGQ